MRPLAMLFVAALMLGGCTILGLSDDDDGVRVNLAPTGVVVENRRSSDIYYAALGENSLGQPGPCVRPDCPRVGPGETREIPFDDIHAAAESARIRVYWWERVRVGDTDVPGPLHTVILSR